MITPSQLRSRSSLDDAGLVIELEKIIDTHLERMWNGGSVSYVLPTRFPRALVEKVIDKYRASGWDVQKDLTAKTETFYVFKVRE